MKNISALFIGLILMVVIFSACNKVKELADVEFNATYKTNLDVDMTEKSENATFSVESTIDPLSNDNVKEYIDKIKQYDIESITIEVTMINKDANLVSGNFEIYTDNNNANWTLSNLPLTMGAKLELGNEDGQWDTVKNIFEEKTSFNIKMAGETDEDGLIFIVKLTIETKITANPL